MTEAGESQSCVFCRVLSGDVPAQVVYESEHSVAFRDIDPQAPTHVLVIPRRHVENLGQLASASPEELADVITGAAAVAEQEGLGRGYRTVANTGPEAHQTVFHAHVHVLGGRAMAWPPG
jgi:histidine triad (HIT) family protein